MRWRNCWMEMEEKQKERERWNRWKPHVWLALQDSEYIWERWGMKKDIIYRQSNLRLYTDWHRMCKTCKDEIKSQETTSEWVSVGNAAKYIKQDSLLTSNCANWIVVSWQSNNYAKQWLCVRSVMYNTFWQSLYWTVTRKLTNNGELMEFEVPKRSFSFSINKGEPIFIWSSIGTWMETKAE